MRAVKAAEKRLWETETTKAYTGLAGDPAFCDAMARPGAGAMRCRPTGIAALATPGGTGAIRQALELVAHGQPGRDASGCRDPTWPNHLSIMKFMGMPFVEYRYFDATDARRRFRRR